MLLSKGHESVAPSLAPGWRRIVLIVGWACLLTALLSPATLKGGSTLEAVLLLAASAIGILGTLTYLIGRRTFWAEYPPRELGFIFAPLILTAVIAIAVALSVVIATILLK